MTPFEYARANDVADAIKQIATDPSAKFIAGGTNLIDLIKYDVEGPARLIDISHLPLRSVEETDSGGVIIGAMVPNSDLAYHPLIEQRYPLLSRAILAGASQQLRNMASTGGNLLQRTRCFYFYDATTPCNKRVPGSGCSAIDGVNRINAILGTSEACIATHPSDMCVALAALDATVHVAGPAGMRTIAFADFHRLPGDTPQRDTNLNSDEIITAIELPAKGFSANYSYLKIRDRLSYAFALVSVAAALELENDTIKDARLALGGVAHKPWRSPAAETVPPASAPRRTRSSRPPTSCCAAPRGLGTTTSRSDWRDVPSSGRWVRPLGQRRNRSPTRRYGERHDSLYRISNIPRRRQGEGDGRSQIRRRIQYRRSRPRLRRRVHDPAGTRRAH